MTHTYRKTGPESNKSQEDVLVKSRKSHSSGAASLKSSRGKARDSQWNEACFGVRRDDKGGSATQHMDFLRSRKEGNPETNARARVDPAAKINRLSFPCEI
jgi:hypothetical protein